MIGADGMRGRGENFPRLDNGNTSGNTPGSTRLGNEWPMPRNDSDHHRRRQASGDQAREHADEAAAFLEAKWRNGRRCRFLLPAELPDAR